MNILGIETSCDETATAVLSAGAVLSSRVHSQVRDHAPYGGVVPEIASRRHVEVLPDLIAESLSESGLGWDRLDRIAVTAGPGLAGALLVGVQAAKALSIATRIPVFPVHHIHGHLASVFLGPGSPAPESVCPMLVLMVSGGHTGLIHVERPGEQVWLGRSVDDAAGEALDKGAQLLGLGYPGGPAIEKAAEGGDPDGVSFPVGRLKKGDSGWLAGDMDPELCFSFSGLKTALLYHLRDRPEARERPEQRRDIAAAYQKAVMDALCNRVAHALKKHPCAALACVGGVAANRSLRTRLAEIAGAARIPLLTAAPEYCTDNAAMIAAAGGATAAEPVDLSRLDVHPSWPL